MMERSVATTINPDEAGTTVLDFLNRRFTYFSRYAWHANVLKGHILRNDHPTTPWTRLMEGDRLTYIHFLGPEPKVQKRFDILFEDSALLVIDKPANLPCHPGGRYFKNTLWALLKETGEFPCLQFVNRLDRETSGIVVIAKTREAARYCGRQFENQLVQKRYVAFVEGHFPEHHIRAEGYLMPDMGSDVRKKQRFCSALEDSLLDGKGKRCITGFRRRRTIGTMSEVEAVPETGRSHQIRATLRSLGFPVVGDKLYGLDEGFFLRFIHHGLTCKDRQRLRLPRQALHAAFTCLKHPQTCLPMKFTAPLPHDLRQLLNPNAAKVEDVAAPQRQG
jgi:23S rRNA pseudouridine955/2504/2580 synthase/23S rRNA pseudouridine1911/1915/1917 synthase